MTNTMNPIFKHHLAGTLYALCTICVIALLFWLGGFDFNHRGLVALLWGAATIAGGVVSYAAGYFISEDS